MPFSKIPGSSVRSPSTVSSAQQHVSAGLRHWTYQVPWARGEFAHLGAMPSAAHPTNRKWGPQPWWFQWDKWGQDPLKKLGWTNPLTIRGMNYQVCVKLSAFLMPPKMFDQLPSVSPGSSWSGGWDLQSPGQRWCVWVDMWIPCEGFPP